jgi:hypothetical protein
MRKKTFLGILALIVLSSFVVFGGSPGLVGKILETVQNNSITRVFSTSADNEFEKSNVKSTEQVQNLKVFPQKAYVRTEETPTREIPDYTLYDQLFRIVFSFSKKAESQELSSEKIIGLTNYFKNRANLTDEENQILQNIALEFIPQVAPIDAQARAIIEDARQKSATGIVSREQSPPAELVNLQEQRNVLVLYYRDRLSASFGADRFAKFDEFIMGDFASRFRVVPLSSVNFDQEQKKEEK